MNAIALKRALDASDDAAFLWVSRRVVVRSSAVTLAALADFDRRLSSLLRELSAEPVLAERLLQDEPSAFESGRAFVTAVVALRSGAVMVFDQLVTRLESRPEFISALASALAWLEFKEVRACLRRLLTASDPVAVRLGLAAAVAHRVDPGAPLFRALDARDPVLRASALEAAGRLAVRDLSPKLLEALNDEDAACRFWAAWSAVRLGEGTGIPVLGRFALGGGLLAELACEIALRALGPREAVRAHARLLSSTRDERLAVLAAGMIGDPALVSWLLDRTESASLARAAGAAFCLVTGRDLRRDDLDAAGPRRGPEPDLAGASGLEGSRTVGEVDPAPNGGSPADDADDDLAWPDVARLRTWWDRNHGEFVPGNRYLAGALIRHAALADVLRTGNQRQRAAAALELALLDPETPFLDVTAPAHRQIGASDPSV